MPRGDRNETFTTVSMLECTLLHAALQREANAATCLQRGYFSILMYPFP